LEYFSFFLSFLSFLLSLLVVSCMMKAVLCIESNTKLTYFWIKNSTETNN
jgi:hypothetical protein